MNQTHINDILRPRHKAHREIDLTKNISRTNPLKLCRLLYSFPSKGKRVGKTWSSKKERVGDCWPLYPFIKAVRRSFKGTSLVQSIC